jgi:hypothetical protein
LLLSKDGTRSIFARYSTSVKDDAELDAVAEELKKPVVVSTRQFGELTLDRRINWFDGTTNWNAQSIQIRFEPDRDGGISAALRTADALWDAQLDWKRKVVKKAIECLLPVKNENWLEDDEPPLTAEEFTSRMTLKTISIYRDGHFSFWHDDGDLFWGHAIEVSGSPDTGLTDADIAGGSRDDGNISARALKLRFTVRPVLAKRLTAHYA